MKSNTKGFTLIELLAVIVILAIIALIASPIILGIIQNARESSMARSVENFASAVNTAISSVMYDTNYGGGDVEVKQQDGKWVATAAGANGTAVTKEPSYSGSEIQCTTITYNKSTGFLSMTGCHVKGSDINFKYDNNPDSSTTTKGAAVREAAAG